MEFSPNNNIVRLCLQGMQMEDNNHPEAAGNFFNEAWNEAGDDFEKFLASYFLSKSSTDASSKIKWINVALKFAEKVNTPAVAGAFPILYSELAKYYEQSGDREKAKKYLEIAAGFSDVPSDDGPFFHGTKADLKVGDLLTAGGESNYQSGLKMNHIYFTALLNGAGLAAALAAGEGRERVYVVEPTGSFENDPNVTNKKFPGNVTRSYRSEAPLKIIDEIENWRKLTSEELQKWREKLAGTKGKIIN